MYARMVVEWGAGIKASTADSYSRFRVVIIPLQTARISFPRRAHRPFRPSIAMARFRLLTIALLGPPPSSTAGI